MKLIQGRKYLLAHLYHLDLELDGLRGSPTLHVV